MHVYFIQQINGGPIKIGKANDPLARLKILQAGNPNQLVLIGVCKASHMGEKLFHKLFDKYSLGREWFEPCEELLIFLDNLPTGAEVAAGSEIPSLANDADCLEQLYEQGFSLREIGNLFGYAGEYIRQKLWQADIDTSNKNRIKPETTIEEAYEKISSNFKLLTFKAV